MGRALVDLLVPGRPTILSFGSKEPPLRLADGYRHCGMHVSCLSRPDVCVTGIEKKKGRKILTPQTNGNECISLLLLILRQKKILPSHSPSF